MQAIIQSFQPNKIPLAVDPKHTTLYTDAFFQLGDQKYSPSQMTPDFNWSSRTSINMTNGWGFVASSGDQPLCGHGSIPPSLLSAFAKRKAFIYVLELMAPLIAMVSLHQVLCNFIVLWIDNRSGLAALEKGWGKNDEVNNMLTFLWAFLARHHIHLHCEWVPSEHNLADGISRHDLTDMHTGNWKLVHLPLKGLYKILKRCTIDVEYAAGEAVDAASRWAKSINSAVLVQNGESVPEMVGGN